MPDADYKVVPYGKGRIPAALNNCDDITMVVTGGIVLNVKEGDYPPAEKLKNYHLAMSRQAVFADRKRMKHHYHLINSNLHEGVVDMSLFIINPAMYDSIPDSDLHATRDKRILYMPRYMNHRDDPTVGTCMGGYDVLQYGSLGHDAPVLNYLTHLYTGEATPRETWGYCFDRLLDYTDGLPEAEKRVVEKLGNLTKKRVGKLRQMLVDIKKAPD